MLLKESNQSILVKPGSTTEGNFCFLPIFCNVSTMSMGYFYNKESKSKLSKKRRWSDSWHLNLMLKHDSYVHILSKMFPKRISLTTDLAAPQLCILIVPFLTSGPGRNLQSFVAVFYSGRQIQTAGSLEAVRVLQDKPGNTDQQDTANYKILICFEDKRSMD